MDDDEKARILDLHYDGEISDYAARELLGDEAFEDAMEKARGAEQMLSGDTSRFLTNDDDEKERVYRRFLQGDATEEDVREVFGDDFDEFVERREFVAAIKETPTNSASEDLIGD